MAAWSSVFDTILVPLDGSALAERALPHALNAVRASGGRLLLSRVAQHGGTATRAERFAMWKIQTYLDNLAAPLREQGVEVATNVGMGDPVAGVLEAVQTDHADLIVMATHGRSGLDRWLHGSVTAGVVEHSPSPVLLVRVLPSEPPVREPSAEPDLLVPLDGSEFGESMLPVVLRLATAIRGRLTLARVVPLPSSWAASLSATTGAYPTTDPEQDEAEALRYLRGVRTRLQAQPGAPRMELDVRFGEPSEAIVAAAQDHDAVLVAMATHARTGLGRLLLGNTADAVLRTADAPLLLVPPLAAARGAAPAAAETAGAAS